MLENVIDILRFCGI